MYLFCGKILFTINISQLFYKILRVYTILIGMFSKQIYLFKIDEGRY